MSTMYPLIWAMKHAPVADALERLILIAMADAADADGCNSFRSIRSHMLIAKGVDKKTIIRRQQALAGRGLIRHDTTTPPARYLRISADRRPVRWEICIPYSWWSDAQRDEIQRERADRGLPPLTPELRPDLPDAPAPKTRADKGKSRPSRSTEERGTYKTPRESGERGTSQVPREVPTSPLAGYLQDTQPSCSYLPQEPSSSSSSSSDPSPSRASSEPGEEEMPSAKETTAPSPEAVALVKALPAIHGDRPGGRLAIQISERLAAGWSAEALRRELIRDLGTARGTGVYHARLASLPDVPVMPVPTPRPEPTTTRTAVDHTKRTVRRCEHDRVAVNCPKCRDVVLKATETAPETVSEPQTANNGMSGMDPRLSQLLSAVAATSARR